MPSTPVPDEQTRDKERAAKPKPPPSGAIAEGEAADPFDLDSLRLDPGYTAGIGVKKLLRTVPVRKPGRQEWFRVHPDAEYRRAVAILDFKTDRETFIVASGLQGDLGDEIFPATLFTAITRGGVVFLWPVRLPADDGRQIDWHRSAAEAAEHAMRTWTRMTANMELGAYDISEALGRIPDPAWPDLSFRDLLQIGFRDRVIDRPDHPAIRKLRGEL